LRSGPTFRSLMSRAEEVRAFYQENPVRAAQRLEGLGVGGYRAFTFSPDRPRLFAAWWSMLGAYLHVWDLKSMTLERVSVLPQCSPLSFRPDGRLLAVDEGGRIALHDPDTNRVVRTLVGRFCDISALAFSPDGQRVAGTGTVEGVTEMRAGQAL